MVGHIIPIIWGSQALAAPQDRPTTLMNKSSTWCMFGMALTRPSLTMQLTTCGQKADTSSNYC